MSEVTVIYGYLNGVSRVEAVEAIVKLCYARRKRIRINKNIAEMILGFLEKEKGFFSLKKDVAIPPNMRYGRIEMSLPDFWKLSLHNELQKHIQNWANDHKTIFLYKVIFNTCHCCRSSKQTALLHFADSDGHDVMICHDCLTSLTYNGALERIEKEKDGLSSKNS